MRQLWRQPWRQSWRQSFSGREYFRGDWSLTVTCYSPFLTAPAVPVIMLDGLVVPPELADVIIATRAGTGQLACTAYPPGYRLSGVELTEAEAVAIRNGAHPLDVLLPPLYIRPLTLAELRSQ